MKKFNPQKIGFVPSSEDKRHFTLYEDGQKIAMLFFYDFVKTPYWGLYKLNHHPCGDESEIVSELVFKGSIPTNTFAKQLLKNTLI